MKTKSTLLYFRKENNEELIQHYQYENILKLFKYY